MSPVLAEKKAKVIKARSNETFNVLIARAARREGLRPSDFIRSTLAKRAADVLGLSLEEICL